MYKVTMIFQTEQNEHESRIVRLDTSLAVSKVRDFEHAVLFCGMHWPWNSLISSQYETYMRDMSHLRAGMALKGNLSFISSVIYFVKL